VGVASRSSRVAAVCVSVSDGVRVRACWKLRVPKMALRASCECSFRGGVCAYLAAGRQSSRE
jgi:hypothetical protein